jgi:multidrug efflux pump subunit AcrB
MRLAEGSSIEATSKVAREAEQLLAGDKDAASYTTYIGKAPKLCQSPRDIAERSSPLRPLRRYFIFAYLSLDMAEILISVRDN